MSICKSCGAEVTWAVFPSGKLSPMEQDPDGRWALTTATVDGTPRVRARIIHGSEEGWTSHFSTCPDADHHRRTL